jgi:hypothetical protein
MREEWSMYQTTNRALTTVSGKAQGQSESSGCSRPGAHRLLRHRGGVSGKELLPILEDAAVSPLDATAVGIAVRSGLVADTSLTLGIDIDPSNVTLLLDKGQWIGCLYLMVMQQKADGTILSKPVKAFDLRFTAEERAQMLDHGLTINHAVIVESAATKLRIVVCDLRSGAVGAVTVPLQKMDLSRRR